MAFTTRVLQPRGQSSSGCTAPPVPVQSSLMRSGTEQRCLQKPSRSEAIPASRPVCSTQVFPEHRRLLPALVTSGSEQTLPGVPKGRATKLERAARRTQAARVPKAVAAAARELGIVVSHLAIARVRKATQLDYLEVLGRLLRCRSLRTIPKHWGAATWDAEACQAVEECYDAGESKQLAQRLLAAVLWCNPSVPRPARVGLPRAVAAVAGWQKLEPSASRPPWPRILAVSTALCLARQGKVLLAGWILLCLETYMRPSEALSLTPMQLVRPIPAAAGKLGYWTIVPRIAELEVPTKTGEFDTSLVMDLERHSILVPMLEYLKSHTAEGMQVFPFEHGTVASEIIMVLKQLHLSHLGLTAYCLRHGGASEDRAQNTRPLLEVMKRGGWKSLNSLRRYEKHGRLQLVLEKLPRRLLLETARDEHLLETMLVPADTIPQVAEVSRVLVVAPGKRLPSASQLSLKQSRKKRKLR